MAINDGSGSGSDGALAGSVCVVVGASTGIGRATAARLVADGAAVVVMMARGAARLRQAAASVGGTSVAVPVDIADPAAVRAAFAEIGERWGRVDALFNVAGVSRLGRLGELSDEDIAYVFAINLLGPIYTARAVLPLMQDGGGTIVNVSSEATLDAMPGGILYGTSKAGLNAFTTMMTRELRGTGIRFCLCILGHTEGTAFRDNFTGPSWERARSAMQEDGYYRRVAGAAGMSVDEVAEALAFVAARPMRQMIDVVHVRAAG
ncbi:SDR family oxidoreductase [Pseudonocardia sp. GCM10023141]|uniref:SDR family oxidoreductase n=1 Tax=Pseudonocardia sp. GCM10023141 TaxID=3252653 RepID=UPI00361C82C3